MENLTKVFILLLIVLKIILSTLEILIFVLLKQILKIYNGTSPIINSEKRIDLIGARHPLIPLDKVVANNISLGKNFLH
jgi:DNA mismatch repair protein MutS2